MLETVRNAIYDTPSISFSKFFQQYVMDVQDTNIDLEFQFLLQRNRLNANTMDLLIENTYERLNKLWLQQ